MYYTERFTKHAHSHLIISFDNEFIQILIYEISKYFYLRIIFSIILFLFKKNVYDI